MIDILIADDSDVQAEYLSNRLSKEKDFKILKISRDGMEAYNDYLTLKPTAFILDLQMPKMSGLDIVNKLLSTPNVDSKKNIIIISGSVPLQSQPSTIDIVKWMLPKPINFDVLFRELRDIKNEPINLQPNIDEQIDYIFINLNIKKYTKGSKYLKNAINIAYSENNSDINISTITKKIAYRNNISNSESIQSAMDKTMKKVYTTNTKDMELKKIFEAKYKITTKDFISRALVYIEKTNNE